MPEVSYVCDYHCEQKPTLKAHIEAVHEGKKSHICSACGKGFATRQKMTIHTETVHEGKKPYECTIYDYKSGTPQNLLCFSA